MSKRTTTGTDVPLSELRAGVGFDEPSDALAQAAAERADGRPRKPAQKKSITLDAEVADSVAEHVERGAADNFSAAINQAAARWAANQDLGVALDELYEEYPDARPSEEAVAKAAARLSL